MCAQWCMCADQQMARGWKTRNSHKTIDFSTFYIHQISSSSRAWAQLEKMAREMRLIRRERNWFAPSIHIQFSWMTIKWVPSELDTRWYSSSGIYTLANGHIENPNPIKKPFLRVHVASQMYNGMCSIGNFVVASTSLSLLHISFPHSITMVSILFFQFINLFLSLFIHTIAHSVTQERKNPKRDNLLPAMQVASVISYRIHFKAFVSDEIALKLKV